MTITPQWLLLSLGLMAGTWILRALPFFTSALDRLPPRAQRFLSVVPAAALGALVIPDSFSAAPLPIVTAALVLAFVMTVKRVPLTITVLTVVLLAWLALAIVPTLT